MLTNEDIINNLTPVEVKYLKLMFALKIGRYKGNKELEEFNLKQEVNRKSFLKVLAVGERNLDKAERVLTFLNYIEKFKRKELYLILTKEGIDFINYAIKEKNEKFN